MPPRRGKGICAMRGNCGKKGMFGQQLPCPDDGDAEAVSANGSLPVTTSRLKLPASLAAHRRRSRHASRCLWAWMAYTAYGMLHQRSDQHAPNVAPTSRTAHRILSCLPEQLSSVPLLFHLFSGPIAVLGCRADPENRYFGSNKGNQLLCLRGSKARVLFELQGRAVWCHEWVRHGSDRWWSEECFRVSQVYGRRTTGIRFTFPDLDTGYSSRSGYPRGNPTARLFAFELFCQ